MEERALSEKLKSQDQILKNRATFRANPCHKHGKGGRRCLFLLKPVDNRQHTLLPVISRPHTRTSCKYVATPLENLSRGKHASKERWERDPATRSKVVWLVALAEVVVLDVLDKLARIFPAATAATQLQYHEL